MDATILGANGFVTLNTTTSETACLYKRVSEDTPAIYLGNVSFVTIGNVSRAQTMLQDLPDMEGNRQLGELPIFYIDEAEEIDRAIPNVYMLMVQQAIDEDTIEEHITTTRCPVCEERHAETNQKLLVLSDYVHIDCLGAVVDAMDAVWAHSDDILPDEL